jgi:hypothetical protein
MEDPGEHPQSDCVNTEPYRDREGKLGTSGRACTVVITVFNTPAVAVG